MSQGVPRPLQLGRARIHAALSGLQHSFVGRCSASIVHVAVLRSVTLALSACTGIITAAFLGPQGRGEQAAMILAPLALAGLATFGLHASLIYNIKADPEHEREYITANLLLTLTGGMIAVGVAWFLEPLWLSKFSQDIVEKARLFLFFTPVVSASQTFIAVLESRSQFGAANGAGCLQSVCVLAILGTLVLLRQLTPVTAAASYACSSFLAFIYLGVCANYAADAHFQPSAHLFGRLLHYGLRFYGFDVITVASGYLDQIVIAAFLPASALGAYVVALSLCKLLTVLPSAAGSVIFPTVAAQCKTLIIDTVAMATRVLVLLNLAAALCLAVFGPHLIRLLLGAKFSAAGAPLVILLFATVAGEAVSILYKAYAASGRPGIVTIIDGIGLAVSFTSMMFFVPLYGTMGAAYGLLLAAFIRLACVLLGMPLFLGVPVPRIIISRQDLAWMKRRFAQ